MPDKDRLNLLDFAEYAEECLGYIGKSSLAQFRKDRRLQLVTERLTEILGEVAGRISTETRAQIAVDWKSLRNLRNILAHRYDSVDHDILYHAVVNLLPEALAKVKAFLSEHP